MCGSRASTEWVATRSASSSDGSCLRQSTLSTNVGFVFGGASSRKAAVGILGDMPNAGYHPICRMRAISRGAQLSKAGCHRHKKFGVALEPNWRLCFGVVIKRKFLVLRTRLASTASRDTRSAGMCWWSGRLRLRGRCRAGLQVRVSGPGGPVYIAMS